MTTRGWVRLRPSAAPNPPPYAGVVVSAGTSLTVKTTVGGARSWSDSLRCHGHCIYPPPPHPTPKPPSLGECHCRVTTPTRFSISLNPTLLLASISSTTMRTPMLKIVFPPFSTQLSKSLSVSYPPLSMWLSSSFPVLAPKSPHFCCRPLDALARRGEGYGPYPLFLTAGSAFGISARLVVMGPRVRCYN